MEGLIILYPAIIDCLRGEGVNAFLFGPRPHGLGISIAHNGNNYLCFINDAGLLACVTHWPHERIAEFDLDNPDIWTIIKDAINTHSNNRVSK